MLNLSKPGADPGQALCQPHKYFWHTIILESDTASIFGQSVKHSPITQKPPLRIAEQFPNVSALGRAVGFESGFRQLDTGDPSVQARALIGQNVILTHMRFGSPYHQLGLPPAKRLTIGFPITGLRNWFGRGDRTQSILPFNHPGGIDGVSGKGFEAFTVSISEDFLADVAKGYRIPLANWLYCPTPESVVHRSAYTDRFRVLLNRILFDTDTELESTCEDALVISLLRAVENNSAVTERSPPRLRARALAQALAYIDDH